MGLCTSKAAAQAKDADTQDDLGGGSKTDLLKGSKLDLQKIDKFQFVIVGFGVAAGYAANQLAELGVKDFDVAIVGEEPTFAYERPALSKGYLFPPGIPNKLPARLPKFHTCSATGPTVQTEEWYQQRNWTCYLSTKVVAIDVKKKLLKCQGPVKEEFVRYEKLIVCTGSKPVRLTCPGSDLKNIFYIRSEQDVAALVRKLERETGNRFTDRKLAPMKGKSGVLQSTRRLGADEQLELSQQMRGDDDHDDEANDHAVVLGAGYLGVEIATSMHGWGFEEVHLAFQGAHLYGKMPWHPKFREKVQAEILRRAPKLILHPGTTVDKLQPRAEGSQALGSVVLSNGTKIETHIFVPAIGTTTVGKDLFPKKAITLVNRDNIATDESLRIKSSETKDVYICGELAFADSGVEAARAMGKHAALTAFNDHMGGGATPPFSFPAPFRYSRLFEYTTNPLIWNQTGDVAAAGLEVKFLGENNECGQTGPFGTFHYDPASQRLKGAVVCGSDLDREFLQAIRKLVESGSASVEDAVNEFSTRGYPL